MATTLKPLRDEARMELEARHGLESLEELQAERASLMDRYNALRAMHGPFGKWEHRRKMLLESLKLRYFNPEPTDPERPEKGTKDLIDAWAHSHPIYLAFVHNGEKAHIEYLNLDHQVSSIEERIKNREVLAGLRRGEMMANL